MTYSEIMPRLDYSPEELDHFRHPRNAGSFPRHTPHLRTGASGVPGAGEVLALFLLISSDGRRIENTRFQAAGSPTIIAVGSWLACSLEGLPVEEALRIDAEKIMTDLQLTETKIHCAQMGAEALRIAFDLPEDPQ